MSSTPADAATANLKVFPTGAVLQYRTGSTGMHSLPIHRVPPLSASRTLTLRAFLAPVLPGRTFSCRGVTCNDRAQQQNPCDRKRL